MSTSRTLLFGSRGVQDEPVALPLSEAAAARASEDDAVSLLARLAARHAERKRAAPAPGTGDVSARVQSHAERQDKAGALSSPARPAQRDRKRPHESSAHAGVEVELDDIIPPEVIAVLPPDAPAGHNAHEKVRYRGGPNPYCSYKIKDLEGKSCSFQTTSKPCGNSVAAAMWLCRVAYVMMVDQGVTKEELQAFKKDMYEKIAAATGTSVRGGDIAPGAKNYVWPETNDEKATDTKTEAKLEVDSEAKGKNEAKPEAKTEAKTEAKLETDNGEHASAKVESAAPSGKLPSRAPNLAEREEHFAWLAAFGDRARAVKGFAALAISHGSTAVGVAQVESFVTAGGDRERHRRRRTHQDHGRKQEDGERIDHPNLDRRLLSPMALRLPRDLPRLREVEVPKPSAQQEWMNSLSIAKRGASQLQSASKPSLTNSAVFGATAGCTSGDWAASTPAKKQRRKRCW